VVVSFPDPQYTWKEGLVNIVQNFWTLRNFGGRDLIGQYASCATHTHYFPHRRTWIKLVNYLPSVQWQRLSPGQGSLAAGTILASLSVWTAAGLFHVGRQDLGVLDASEESLALRFVLWCWSLKQETAEVTRVRTKVTYEARFSKSPRGCLSLA